MAILCIFLEENTKPRGEASTLGQDLVFCPLNQGVKLAQKIIFRIGRVDIKKFRDKKFGPNLDLFGPIWVILDLF